MIFELIHHVFICKGAAYENHNITRIHIVIGIMKVANIIVINTDNSGKGKGNNEHQHNDTLKGSFFMPDIGFEKYKRFHKHLTISLTKARR